jgi:trehalose transport system permease protein
MNWKHRACTCSLNIYYFIQTGMKYLFGFIQKNYFEILLATPLVFYIVAFTYTPVLQVMVMSLDANGARPGFVFGFKHYAEIFHLYQFKQALFNTFFITFVGLTLELLLGLAIAIQFNKQFKGRALLRILFLVPLGIPTIVAAANMRYLFDTNGFFNQVLLKLQIINIPINWVMGGPLTLMTVVVSDMWKVTPMVMLILLAGLQNIPEDVYLAARMDGATPWQVFRKVTLPLLKPSITMALVIRGIDAFRIFELPLVLVGKSEPVLATFAFSEYSEALNPYTSAADSTILLLLILISILSYYYLTGAKMVVGQE